MTTAITIGLAQVLGNVTRARSPHIHIHIHIFFYGISFKIGQLLNGFEIGSTIHRAPEQFQKTGKNLGNRLTWTNTNAFIFTYGTHGRSPHTNIIHTFDLMKSVWIVIWRYCGPIVTSEHNVNFINNTWVRLPLCLCESRAWLMTHNTYWTRIRVTQFEIPTE